MAGNSFGETFRFTTWGESHGSAIGCVVDGVPPRVALTAADLQHWLDRRKPGQSRFTTQRREPDTVKILSGAFEGESSEEHTSELQSLMRISYAVFCLKKKTNQSTTLS